MFNVLNVLLNKIHLIKPFKQLPMNVTAFDFSGEVLSHRDALRYFALSLTNNSDDADDLVQETLLKAFTYKTKFEANTNLKAWLYTIMKNIFINNYRKIIKVRMVFDGSKELFKLNIPETKKTFDPDAKLNYKEMMLMVNTLDDDFRIPLTMYFEGFKYKEIADHLSLPIGTIKSRIFLARKQMMNMVKEFA